jgi:AraC family transcriptional regulator
VAKSPRATTSSDYDRRLNAAVDWITQHLDESISLKEIATAANFSAFHFHRIFRASTGETINAFVKRLRLERALMLMRATPGKSLTSIALEAGFGSSSNFSRVFRTAYGSSPAKANVNALLESRKHRQDTETARTYALSMPRVAEGSAKPTPSVRIERWADISLAYVRVIGGYLNPQALIDGYHAIEGWADRHGLDRVTSQLIGMSIDDPDVVPLRKCRYDFCRTVASRPPPRSGAHFTTLRACDWAIAPCKGDMGDVEHVWNYLFRDWLPASGWQPAAIPALEIFNRRPEEIGWDRFDMLCCIPIEPLR